MKSHRFQRAFRKNASKWHRLVGEALHSGPFRYYRVYQEYPVKKINPSFRSWREKFDWVILDLKVVIEIHGEFHYKPIPWGNKDEAKQLLLEQQRRDRLKKEAAENAGWRYHRFDTSALALFYRQHGGVTELFAGLHEHLNFYNRDGSIYRDTEGSGADALTAPHSSSASGQMEGTIRVFYTPPPPEADNPSFKYRAPRRGFQKPYKKGSPPSSEARAFQKAWRRKQYLYLKELAKKRKERLEPGRA